MGPVDSKDEYNVTGFVPCTSGVEVTSLPPLYLRNLSLDHLRRVDFTRP